MSDLLSTALAAVRDAERRLVAGEIPRCEFDSVAGSSVAVIAEAAERYLWLRDEGETGDFGTPFVAVVLGDGVNSMGGSELDAAIDAARKGSGDER